LHDSGAVEGALGKRTKGVKAEGDEGVGLGKRMKMEEEQKSPKNSTDDDSYSDCEEKPEDGRVWVMLYDPLTNTTDCTDNKKVSSTEVRPNVTECILICSCLQFKKIREFVREEQQAVVIARDNMEAKNTQIQKLFEDSFGSPSKSDEGSL